MFRIKKKITFYNWKDVEKHDHLQDAFVSINFKFSKG